MTIRITGMNSGLDTESIIQELASARSIKVQSIQKSQTKLSWKIDAWKSLNTKIYSLYTDVLSDMRFSTAYAKKTTKVSNSNAVSVITGSNAVNGVQSLKIKQLAKAGYLTGAQVKNADENNTEAITADTKLSDLGAVASTAGEGEESKFKFDIKVGNGEKKTLEFGADAKISDVVSALKAEGVNANFDEKNGRFFVSSTSTGKAYDFDITAVDGDDNSLSTLKSLGLYVDPNNKMNTDQTSGLATKIDGANAEIILNGAAFESDDNTFEINGLTYNVMQVTGEEEISISTENDTSGIYDMIKNFFTKYNELINEMDKLYNADSASKYEPLTDEEKDAMSEKEIETWENKIKDSLLRRDSTLGSVSSALKQIMMEGVEVGGKKMYLSDFGIETLSYFTAAENEKNAYHIDGDPDDANTKSNGDKLKTAIANDPQLVTDFFSQLSKNLYDSLTKQMASTDYSSAFTVYNDKEMKKELTDYDSKIADAQDKLNDYLDKWYAKFSKMETAMAKMQSKTDALTNMLG
ncbi:MAG: flagellar filament capping protein FliD [Lachnospiraceae bacterium]